MANITTSPETNVITTDEMKKIREIDFTRRFAGTILNNLIKALGVTRKIPLIEGTTMYYYTTEGSLEDGTVDEGAVIPLSQFERVKNPIGEIHLKKWRKASTAEAILKSGYDEAVRQTDAKALLEAQKGIRTDFFGFLTDADGTKVYAPTFQMVLSRSWGNLQVLFEDDAVEPVHFINPLTIADYLGGASITVQTAFGMNYIEDFLGLGTVIMTSQVPVNKVYSTAKENIIMYYVPVTADAMRALNLTADVTGYIGINSGYPTEKRAQVETLIMSGIQFLCEYEDGIVEGTIGNEPEGATGATGATGA